ncbi:MAG TPA: OB-fold nucleic acid binding domain-containing protein, partial [Cystobacter sp.]
MTTDNNQADPSSSSAPEASVETVRKVYAKDLREKDPVHTVFRVAQKTRVTARSGKVFLSLVLTDKSGEIDARVFDKVDVLEPTFSTGDYALVHGHVIAFHGKTQVVIEALEKLDPEPLDPKEFEPPPAPPAPAAAAPEESAAPKRDEPRKDEARKEEPRKDEPAAARREESAPAKGGEGPGGA